MLHPDTRLQWISDDIGHGVFATADIPMGTILWVLDPLDRVLHPDEIDRLEDAGLAEILEHYSYFNGAGARVLCWDHGRFMNHSCAPISLSPGTDFELAVRDVAAGEQITCDYASLNLERTLQCGCGEPGCRGAITSDLFEELAPLWDARLQAAVARSMSVPQPLMRWLKDASSLAGWAAAPPTLPSAILHRYRPAPRMLASGAMHA